ncbi:MAG: hypothetical protein P4M11_07055 [Candidatus Pacebacteria bacterium]|nr:hypothetical protein [Candidatus Paceibacterota bacterium]
MEKKLFAERQCIMQEIARRIKGKEDDTAKLVESSVAIDEQLAKMQATFGTAQFPQHLRIEKHKARVTKLRAIISSVEKMNNRIYQESHNKKALSIHLHNLISKFEITPEMENLLMQQQVDAGSISDVCSALVQIHQMLGDTGDFGDIVAVKAAKEKAQQLFDTFIVQFTYGTASVLKYVLTTKSKQILPSMP